MTKKAPSIAKKRLLNLIAFLVLLGIEILIARFVHDNLIRPYVGDILVVAVLYYFIRIFFPDGLRYLLLYILIFSITLEFAQLLGLAKFLSGDNPFLKVLLGTTFSVLDILCYTVGCVLVAGLEWLRKKKAGLPIAKGP